MEYLGDNRDEASLDGYLRKLSLKRREKIKSVAVDMWDPYLASIRKHVPDAEEKVVFDRYHLMTHMGKAVDEVRKAESREMVKNDDERRRYPRLKPWVSTGFKWHSFKNKFIQKRDAMINKAKDLYSKNDIVIHDDIYNCAV